MQTTRALLGAAIFAILTTSPAIASVLCSSPGYGGPLSVSDVYFRGNDADDCYGPVDDNDAASNVWPGGGWTLLAKDDVSGIPTTGTVHGALFSVDAQPDTPANAGTWQLSWSWVGTPTYDLIMDLIVVVKGGNHFAAYLFEQERFTASPTTASGTWQIAYPNPGGEIPDLSHLSVYYRNPSHAAPLPEPHPLWLMAAALLGLGWLRLTRRSLPQTAC